MNNKKQLYNRIVQLNYPDIVKDEVLLGHILMAIDATCSKGHYLVEGNRLEFIKTGETSPVFLYNLEKTFSQQSDWFYDNLLELLK